MVNICNSSQEDVDVSQFTLHDNSATQNKQLSSQACILSPGQILTIPFNFLNNTSSGDYILLKKGEDIVDCVSYGNVDCPNTWPKIEVDDKCVQLIDSQWQSHSLDNCDFSQISNCTVQTPSIGVTEPDNDFLFEIQDIPDKIEKGKKFSIGFNLENGQPETDYQIKVFDYRGDRSCFVKTMNGDVVLNSTSKWESYPIYKTNISGKISDYIFAIIDDCTEKFLEDGDYATIKLKLSIGHTTPDSHVVGLIIPTSNPTPTPTIKPTSTPYPTSTPKTTSTPTPTVSPTVTDTPTDTPSPVPQVLGNTNQTQDIPDIYKFEDPKSASSSAKFTLTSYAPYFLIIVGGGLLLAPAIFSKFS